VADILYPFYNQKNAEGAAEAIVRESFKRWKRVGYDLIIKGRGSY
jgi:hypothetical protein